MAIRMRKIAVPFLALASLLIVTCRANGADPQSAKQADRIVIEKSKRTMTLMSDGKVLKTYKVALGGQPVGAKQRIGVTRRRKGSMWLIRRRPPASFIARCMFLIPTRATEKTLTESA